MIVTIAGQKGGAGKTTVCINLAVEMARSNPDQSIAILDCDRQQACIETLHSNRKGNLSVHAGFSEPHRLLKKMRSQYDAIFVDAPGQLADVMYKAVSEADIVIIPIQPSPLDVRSAVRTVDAFLRIKLQLNKRMVGRFLASRVYPKKALLEYDLRESCAQFFPQFPMLKTTLYDRQSYKHALTAGQSVPEFDKSSRAATEILDLLAEVISIYAGMEELEPAPF
jgi:chromosome partitioning protein